MVISILLNTGKVNFLKIIHSVLIAKKQIFQLKILDEINSFLIRIYILIRFKVFIHSPRKFIWSTNIQNALLYVYLPP